MDASMPLEVGPVGEARATVGALERFISRVQDTMLLHRLQLVELSPADITQVPALLIAT